MRKTILSLLGSTLIIASMANAATAAEHHTRHHKTYTSVGVRNAFGSYDPNAVRPEDQSAFGTVFRWKSGMQPDDWRQSVNGN
jgi:Ni/Co efflux regulator RcnB